MADFWAELVAACKLIAEDISIYVHSALSLDIDKLIGDMVRTVGDYCIYILRDFFDIFGV